MNFARLQRSDVAAVLAAFALLFVMSLDWYGSEQADEVRRSISEPQGAQGGEVQRGFNERAEEFVDNEERSAWRADGVIDRAIMLVLLIAYALALLSAFLRAAGRRPRPPFTPAALGSAAAGIGALLVAYRIWQEPGLDSATTVKAAAPLAILVLGFLALALATAYRSEESGRAWERMDRAEAAAAEPPPGEPPPGEPPAATA